MSNKKPKPSNDELNNYVSSQKRSGDKAKSDGGWNARHVYEVDKKIKTLDGLIKKVGPNSPRYDQLVSAKSRQVAGRAKITSRPFVVSEGSRTRNTHPAKQDGSSKYSGQKHLMRTQPENFNPKKPYNYNIVRPEQMAARDRVAADQLSSRKSILGGAENAKHFKLVALEKFKNKKKVN